MKDRQNRSEDARENIREGKINQVKGHAKEAWGEVTDDRSREHEGRRDRVKGEIQEEYGRTTEKSSRLEENLDELDSERKPPRR